MFCSLKFSLGLKFFKTKIGGNLHNSEIDFRRTHWFQVEGPAPGVACLGVPVLIALLRGWPWMAVCPCPTMARCAEMATSYPDGLRHSRDHARAAEREPSGCRGNPLTAALRETCAVAWGSIERPELGLTPLTFQPKTEQSNVFPWPFQL